MDGEMKKASKTTNKERLKGQKMYQTWRKALFVFVALALANCANHEDIETDVSVADSSQALYIYRASLWPNPGNINVCWNNPGEVPAGELLWAEDAVARTWETYSAIDFVGWGTCAENATGIRITIEDSQPRCNGLGEQLDGMEEGMVLNFTFQNWGCGDAEGNQITCTWPYGSENWTRQDFIEMFAVHEFGHALGFSHEQNRPDTPASCTAGANGADGDVTYGDWDLDSVMNYCNPIWNNGGELSATDIAGLQAYYGDTGTAPTCSDGIRNQGEGGIDCDGPCPDFCFREDEVHVPGRVEAEDPVAASDTTFGNDGDPDECGVFGSIDMEVTGDSAGGGCNVGWTEAGEWIEYNILVHETQAFDITARLASQYSGTSVHIEIDGVDVTGSLVAPANGWQSYEDRVAQNITIERGRHVVRLLMETDNININYIDFTLSNATEPTCDDGIQNQEEEGIDCGGPCPPCAECEYDLQCDDSNDCTDDICQDGDCIHQDNGSCGHGQIIPGRVQAEDYNRYYDTTSGNTGGGCDTGDDVDKEITGDNAGGGCNVGWTGAGEWLEYDVTVATSQSFDIVARVASQMSGRSLRIEIDGVDVTGPLSVPANGWQSYEDVVAENITISAGTHGVRVYMITNYININYLDFELSGAQSDCGDGTCDAADEDCETCPEDCGDCPVYCPNGTCDPWEGCDTCPADCGTCPDFFCGDGTCDPEEDCDTCPADCGQCQGGCTCPSGCDAVVDATADFVKNGADNTCYFFNGSAGSYINSWNTVEVNLNGADVTNTWIGASSYPTQTEGGYYLYVNSTLPWSHVEVVN